MSRAMPAAARACWSAMAVLQAEVDPNATFPVEIPPAPRAVTEPGELDVE
ncbi:hypothetical protein BH23VER1_BH23VER1_27460 [soil metagenome]